MVNILYATVLICWSHFLNILKKKLVKTIMLCLIKTKTFAKVKREREKEKERDSSEINYFETLCYSNDNPRRFL